ncbi:MAG: insulinase family protein [Ignavibacteriales bacterium]|nr:insulinase family protein [Ignavibacteriales bacterium]HOJ19461.1 pitrilysin family protein [Ignavibacteriaceae bacterium]HPO57021.1 pitrilysin family protein [Ignavibacteriaceae bacterium]
MKYLFFVLIAALLVISKPQLAQSAKDIDIPYTKFVLKNGLTLLVHEDHKAPIVAVNIWYHVGSKNEKPGRTGFAHLFEHLMFNGSENYDDDYFKALEKVGATDLNGTTSEDRTNYFQNVPTSALDVALWMESDRMGHLIGAITQAKLDEQRGVVQNEKRQYDNEPYMMKIEDHSTKNCYPVGHPYSWSVIGSMEDLDAAKLEDVHEWFKNYYGPNNAVLVLAGDITPQLAYEKVNKFFGDIPPIQPVQRPVTWVAKMTGLKRFVVEDRVPQSRIIKIWNIPEWSSKDLFLLDLASDVLAVGKNSRLYKRLVYEEQIATDARAYISPKELGSQFTLDVTAKPGIDLAKIEQILDEEFAKLLNDGPTQSELELVKTNFISGFVRGIERIGGFGGKSDILAQSFIFSGSPDFYKTRLQWLDEMKAADIKKAMNDWLSDGVSILEIHPYENLVTETSTADRSKLPETSEPPVAKFPKIERSTLSNGLKIVLATRTAVPVVNFLLSVDAGFAADQNLPEGTSSLAMNLMDEGTKTKTSLQLNEELLKLGANLYTGSGLDNCNVGLSALKGSLDKSLELFADIILNPSFPDKELDRLKNERFSQIKREKSSPTQMALRVLPKYIYGEDHPYGTPFTGSGYEETVKNITRNDIVSFHDKWFKPNNSTLIVVGDISMDELKSKIDKLFKNWKSGDAPKKKIENVSHKTAPVVYVMDKPGSPQSVVIAGHVAPPRSDENYLEMEALNYVLGGTFTSRINMNLREDKHWSYGAGSTFFTSEGQMPFLVFAFVQGDKTKESIQEIHKEISGFLTDKPITSEEISKMKLNKTLELPGSWETNNAILNSLSEIVDYNLPDNYYDTYVKKINSLSDSEITKVAKRILAPDKMIWVVVGDLSKIEDPLKELGYKINVIDTDGNIIKK